METSFESKKKPVDKNKALRLLWFAYISGLIMWFFMTQKATVESYLQDKLLAYTDDSGTYFADFVLYYTDGKMSIDCFNQKIDMWDPHLQHKYHQDQVPNVNLGDKIFFSQYPPYLKILHIWMPIFPIKVTWIIWELLGLSGIVFSVYLLLQGTLKGKFEKAFAYVGVLASYPAWICFRLGQVALMLFPALIGYWVALERKMWFRAGLLGGFCLIKLQYTPIIFLTGFILGGMRFAAGYIVTCLLFFVGSLAILGWDNLINYPKALSMGEFSGGMITGVSPQEQQNLRGQLVILLNDDGQMVHMLSAAFCLIATVFSTYLWWRYSRWLKGQGQQFDESERRRRFMILASFTMILLLVSSPHCHRQDYVVISLPAIWLMYSVVGDFPIGEAAVSGVSKNLVLWIRYFILSFPVASWFFYIGPKMAPLLAQIILTSTPQLSFIAQLFMLPIQPFFVWAVGFLILIWLTMRQVEKLKPAWK